MIHRVLVETQSGGFRSSKQVYVSSESSKREGARISRTIQTLLRWKLEAKPSKPVVLVSCTHEAAVTNHLTAGTIYPSTKDLAAAIGTSDAVLRVLLCRAKKAGTAASIRGVGFRYAFQ